MSKRAGLLLFVLLAVPFLVMNRGAYHGFFENDDLMTLGFTPAVPLQDYLKIGISPLFQRGNFRPVGHFYYRVAEHFFGLDFPRYIAIVQAIHLLNVWFLWILVRQLGAKPWPAAAACAFFAFHMALFDAFWKPQSVFDLLCGTFCLLSLIAYSRQHWILSFAAFWLAYKSKELAVMLPVALACYEYWFGKRRWLRLAPFVLVSVSFGVQGMLLNPNANQNNNYTFHFTPAALAKTSVYYAGQVVLVPYLGFVVLFAAFLARNRRTWFGLASMGAFFLPLLFLPGRLHGVYCYVPFTGLAIAFSGIAESVHPAVIAAFLLLFVPADYSRLRANRRHILAAADEVREWFGTLATFAKPLPRLQAVLFDGTPAGVDRFGVEGALGYLFHRSKFEIAHVDDQKASNLLQFDRLAILSWDRIDRKLSIPTHTPGTVDLAYLEIRTGMPIWQLGVGWYPRAESGGWIAPDATARLYRPENAREFELRVNVGPELLQNVGPVKVQISLNGLDLEPRRFNEAGFHEARWELSPASAGTVRVAFHVEPGYRRPASPALGIAIQGFGFPDK